MEPVSDAVTGLKRLLEARDISPDRRTRMVLTGLQDALTRASVQTDRSELDRLKTDLHRAGLLDFCVQTLRLDPSRLDGGWSTATTLAQVLSSCCVGAEPDSEDFHRLLLPSVMDGLLSLASQLAIRAGECLNLFRKVMESVGWLLRAHRHLATQVLSSLHYEQIQMCDEVSVSLSLVIQSLVIQSLVIQSLVIQSLVIQSLVLQRLVLQSLVLQSLVLQSLVIQSLVIQSLVIQSLVIQSLVIQSLVIQSLVLQSLVIQRLVIQSLVLQSLVIQSLVIQILVLQSLVIQSLVLQSLVIQSLVIQSLVLQSLVIQSLVIQSLVLQSLVIQSLVIQSLVIQSLVIQSLVLQSLVIQSLVIQSLVIQSLVLQSLVIQSLVIQSLVIQSLVIQSLVIQSLVIQSLVIQSLVLQSLVIQRLVIQSLVIQSLVLQSLVLQILVIHSLVIQSLVIQRLVIPLSLVQDFLSGLSEEAVMFLLDDAVGQLAVSLNAAVGGAAVRLVLLIATQLETRPQPLLQKFRGLDSLLNKDWRGRGFDQEVDQLIALLQSDGFKASHSQDSTEHVRAACVIQAAWRSYQTRRRVKSLPRAVSTLQRRYRARRRQKEQQEEAQRWEEELRYQLCVKRQRARRAFHQKQRQQLHLLPPEQVQSYLAECERCAAVVIQKFWRGFRQRRHYNAHRHTLQHTHTQQQAARTLQRAVRRFLKKRSSLRAPPTPSLWIGQKGLTDSQRAELKRQVEEHIALHPSSVVSQQQCVRLHEEAQRLLLGFLLSRDEERKEEEHRRTLLVHTHTQLDLLTTAPSLAAATATDAELFQSPSAPVAARARQSHNAILQASRLPWWRMLGETDRDDVTHRPAHLDELEAEFGGLFVGGGVN
ncbi:IQ calmodulin-binding motif-containing protein 1 [Diretmus argenteus]